MRMVFSCLLRAIASSCSNLLILDEEKIGWTVDSLCTEADVLMTPAHSSAGEPIRAFGFEEFLEIKSMFGYSAQPV